jgi:hypothetical protein
MKYELVKGFKNERFRQVIGVNITTFNKMEEALGVNYAEVEAVLADSTEIPIERPVKGQKKYYSGKKNDIR